LVARWCPVPLANVELKIVDLSRPTYHLSVLRRAVVQVDGCLVYGQALAGNIFAEMPLERIVEAFVAHFIWFINNRLAFGTSDDRRSQRVLAKLALRCLEWAAVLNGAAVSSSMIRYVSDVERYLPQLHEMALRCWTLYITPSGAQADTVALVAILDRALEELR